MSDIDEGTEDEAGGGGLIKIILIVVVVLLLMVGTAVGTLFATGFFDEKSESEDPETCLLYTSPSPRYRQKCRMPSSG